MCLVYDKSKWKRIITDSNKKQSRDYRTLAWQRRRIWKGWHVSFKLDNYQHTTWKVVWQFIQRASCQHQLQRDKLKVDIMHKDTTIKTTKSTELRVLKFTEKKLNPKLGLLKITKPQNYWNLWKIQNGKSLLKWQNQKLDQTNGKHLSDSLLGTSIFQSRK